MANACFEFINPQGREAFLSSKELQDLCFDQHVKWLKQEVMRLGEKDNLSGAIAVCHLLGAGGLKDFIFKKIDGADALGTHASDYYREFSGYEIP
jgi:hypothetical protein